MNADKVDYYANLMRGVPDKDLGRKIREIIYDVHSETYKEAYKKGYIDGVISCTNKVKNEASE